MYQLIPRSVLGARMLKLNGTYDDHDAGAEAEVRQAPVSKQEHSWCPYLVPSTHPLTCEFEMACDVSLMRL